MSPAGPTMAPLAPRLPSNPTDMTTFISSLPLYPSAISFISNDVLTEFGAHQLPFLYKQQQEFPISPLPELGPDATFLVGGQLMKDTASNSFGLDRTWGAEFEQGLISIPQASLAETGLDGNLPCNNFLTLLSSSFPPSCVATLGSGAGKSKLNLGENWPGLRNAASLTVDLSKGGLSIEDPAPCSYSFQCITSDPGFAERAAQFSSFNGQACLDHLAPPIMSTEVGKAYIGSDEQSMVATKSLPLCSPDSNGSSVSEMLIRNNVPAAACEGPIAAKREPLTLTQMGRVCMSHSNEADGSVVQGDSSVTEQGSSFQDCLKQSQKCSRKSSDGSSIPAKNGNGKDSKATLSSEPKAKRLKSQRSTKQFEQKLNIELHKANNSDNAVDKEGEKPQEAPKPQYVHVRARRGEATDSHSLAERVRRGKISERLKFLQELVPTCNKVSGKAGMLDEIINYVQSLQHQVEFLSTKLATLSPASCLDNKEKLLKEGSESAIVFAAEGNSTTYPPPYQPSHQSPLYVPGGLDVNPVRSMQSPHLGHREAYWNNTLCQIGAIQMKLELS